MDFLDPKKKRAHRIRLFIGYGLMAIALGIATTILVFEANGFDLDRKTGTVIQNGLLFIDAHPEQATITLNGEDKGQTDARLVIPDGQYTIELKRDGYRGWKRTFKLEGSSIERLVYPFLFPEKLDTSDVQLYSETPLFSTQSPDRKWVLVQRPGGINVFDLMDLSHPKTVVTAHAVHSKPEKSKTLMRGAVKKPVHHKVHATSVTKPHNQPEAPKVHTPGNHDRAARAATVAKSKLISRFGSPAMPVAPKHPTVAHVPVAPAPEITTHQ